MSLVWRTLGKHRRWLSRNEKKIKIYCWSEIVYQWPHYLISGDYWPQLQQGLYVECVRLCYHSAVKLIWVLEGDIMRWANLFLPNIATNSAVNLAQNVAFTHIEFHLGYPSRSIFSAFSINRDLIMLFKLSSSKNEIKNLCILASWKNLIRLERAQ